MPKLAIATLLKDPGHNFNNWEHTLVIVRNESISKNFKGKCDLIFFHEGNLSEEYMERIKFKSPRGFNIKFIEVPNFKPTLEELEYYRHLLVDPPSVYTGYTSMCTFWSYRFMDFLDEYDYVIRIDDDCIALSDIQSIVDNLQNKYLAFPYMSGENFRHGFEDFIKMYFDNPPIKDDKIRTPYTNFCGFNLNKIRNDKRIINFFKEVHGTQFIHKYTWTDTLLWGLLIEYLLKESDWVEDTDVKYIHLSHLAYVN